jgi:creatinine amidohydrolase
MLWEELTAWEFDQARDEAGGVCLLPFGILESHGPHLPLGTDTMWVYDVAVAAARLEPAVVFPPNSLGYLAAKQIPGNVCLPFDLVTKILDELCAEIGRNGFTRIVIVNGHGGNVVGANYFVQTTVTEKKPYAVYHFYGAPLITPALRRLHEDPPETLDADDRQVIADLVEGRRHSSHAGVDETSLVAGVDERLVKLDRAYEVDFSDQDRLAGLRQAGVVTWNDWYARFPNNYAGDPAGANARIGRAMLDEMASGLSKVIALVKADRTLEVQGEYFSRWIGG